MFFSINPDQAPVVVAELVQADVQVFQVIHKRQSLEEFFIAVTNSEGDPLQDGDGHD